MDDILGYLVLDLIEAILFFWMNAFLAEIKISFEFGLKSLNLRDDCSRALS